MRISSPVMCWSPCWENIPHRHRQIRTARMTWSAALAFCTMFPASNLGRRSWSGFASRRAQGASPPSRSGNSCTMSAWPRKHGAQLRARRCAPRFLVLMQPNLKTTITCLVGNMLPVGTATATALKSLSLMSWRRLPKHRACTKSRASLQMARAVRSTDISFLHEGHLREGHNASPVRPPPCEIPICNHRYQITAWRRFPWNCIYLSFSGR